MMSRILSVALILLCFEVGVLLFVFPWGSLWTKNYFVNHFPWVAMIARNYFVRGAVSGLGLADIWLAVDEFRRFRQQGHPAHSRTPR